MDTELLSASEAARQLHISVSLLAQMRYRGVGPKYVKISPRKVFYTQAALDEYVQAMTRQSTAAAS